mgnify:CR=1 FL=1
MGFFSYAYLARFDVADGHVKATREIYETPTEERVLFTWEEGTRAPGLTAYAEGLFHCSDQLDLLPGYPRVSEIQPDEEGDFFLQEDFRPPSESHPVLFFLLLPKGHVPVTKHDPFTQPTRPFVDVRDDRLFVCYAVIGPATIQFWIRALEDGDTLSQYDLNRLLARTARKAPKLTVELNLGILKIRSGG